MLRNSANLSYKYWVTFILVVLAAYRNVLFGFFQQDEWLSFAHHIFLREQGIKAVLKDAFFPSVGHYQPLNTVLVSLVTAIFGLNYSSYAFLSIGLHLVTVSILFYLTKMILKDIKLAFFVALLFGVTAAGFQATSWVLADIGVHFATIFSSLSLLSMFKFVKSRKNTFFIFSLASLLVSLLFKEIGIGLFLLLPALLVFFSSEELSFKSFHAEKRYILVLLAMGILYILIRASMLYLPKADRQEVLITESQTVNYIAYNMATFPFKGLAQNIIPVNTLLDFSYSIGNFFDESVAGAKGTTAYDNFVQKKVLEGVSLTFSLLVIILAIGLWRINRASLLGKSIIFALALVLVNLPVFALSPERTGRLFIIDSRNLYFVSFGTSLLIISIVAYLTKVNFLRTSAILLFALANIFWLNNYLSDIAQAGASRESILTEISDAYPKLPGKVIFYTESDTAYYGLLDEEKIMPFQSGFGQTLLVWYYLRERWPKEFLQNRFLWEITEQGYSEAAGRGFGYFRNMNLLRETMEQYNIPLKSVIAFSWEEKKQILRDVSQEIQDELY